MAETASLTNAYSHARVAAEATQQTQWDHAAEEHQSAATDFARAAKCTTDIEALRILKLLEQQHQKLAQIIRASQDAPPEIEVPTERDKQTHSTTAKPSAASPPSSADKAVTTKSRPTTTVLATAKFGSQARDSSPSLARDIASRRGIPPPGRTQPSAAARARIRQLSPESQRRARTAVPSNVPPSVVDSQASIARQAKQSRKAEDDESFAKFYSNITTGTMSKLSSVLAYAGLPLAPEEPAAAPRSKSSMRSSQSSATATHDPDVKKIFSKAALDAIEDEHRQRGTLGHGLGVGPAESFYLVPSTGMSATYASMILKNPHHEDDDQAFVDAREEVQGPSSPTSKLFKSGGNARRSFGKERTKEELELENSTLKHTLEQVAGRLANFEAHAQDASMALLTQSMIGSQRPSGDGGGGADPALLERLRLSEQEVEKAKEEKQLLENHAMKQEKHLRKMKAKYDQVYESARGKMKDRKKVEKEAGETAPDETAEVKRESVG